MESIYNHILKVVSNSKRQLSQHDLEILICKSYGIERRHARVLVRELILKGELEYIYKHGFSFVEISFNKPVRLADKVYVKPPEISFLGNPDDIVINIRKGTSFGNGKHPTTCLSVRAIEKCMMQKKNDEKNISCYNKVLDVGTGTGILAITAVKLGARMAVGTDIDMRSLFEARKNVELNNIEDSVEIISENIENITDEYDLITANLRYPTLLSLYQALIKLTKPEGLLILSGIKDDEKQELLETYTKTFFECIHISSLKDWVCMCFRKIRQ